MSDIDAQDAIKIGVAFFSLLILFPIGILTFASANLSNPLNGLQQLALGLIIIGAAVTLLLAAIDKTDAIGDFLHFLEDIFNRF